MSFFHLVVIFITAPILQHKSCNELLPWPGTVAVPLCAIPKRGGVVASAMLRGETVPDEPEDARPPCGVQFNGHFGCKSETSSESTSVLGYRKFLGQKASIELHPCFSLLCHTEEEHVAAIAMIHSLSLNVRRWFYEPCNTDALEVCPATLD